MNESILDFMFFILIIVSVVGPYFLIPTLFKFVGGAFGRVAGMASNTEGGIGKKLRGVGSGRRQTSKGFMAKAARKKEGVDNRARISNRRRLARTQFREGNFSEAKDTMLGDLKETWSPSGRKGAREANKAELAAEVTKGRNDVRGNYATKQAGEIEIQAQTIRAQTEFEKHQNDEIAKGNELGARDVALQRVRESIQKDVESGRASDAQVAGFMQFMGGQKSAGEINNFQDFIADLSDEKGAKTKAAQQYQNAFGNSAVYGAVVGTSPGAKAPIAANKEEMKKARARALSEEAAPTIAGAKPSAIKEALSAGSPDQAEAVYNKLAEAYASGGETRAGIKLDRAKADEAVILDEVIRRSAPPPPPSTSPPTDDRGYM